MKIGFVFDHEETVEKEAIAAPESRLDSAARLTKDKLNKEMERMKRIYNLMDMARACLNDNDERNADAVYKLASSMMNDAETKKGASV